MTLGSGLQSLKKLHPVSCLLPCSSSSIYRSLAPYSSGGAIFHRDRRSWSLPQTPLSRSLFSVISLPCASAPPNTVINFADIPRRCSALFSVPNAFILCPTFCNILLASPAWRKLRPSFLYVDLCPPPFSLAWLFWYFRPYHHTQLINKTSSQLICFRLCPVCTPCVSVCSPHV